MQARLSLRLRSRLRRRLRGSRQVCPHLRQALTAFRRYIRIRRLYKLAPQLFDEQLIQSNFLETGAGGRRPHRSVDCLDEGLPARSGRRAEKHFTVQKQRRNGAKGIQLTETGVADENCRFDRRIAHLVERWRREPEPVQSGAPSGAIKPKADRGPAGVGFGLRRSAAGVAC